MNHHHIKILDAIQDHANRTASLRNPAMGSQKLVVGEVSIEYKGENKRFTYIIPLSAYVFEDGKIRGSLKNSDNPGSATIFFSYNIDFITYDGLGVRHVITNMEWIG